MTAIDSPTLLSLADRILKLTRSSREIDCEIAVAVGWFAARKGRKSDVIDYVDIREAGRENWQGCGGDQLVPEFTASLDAAMTLVPEGLPILVRDGYDDAPGDKRPYAHVMNEIGEGYAATKALAIVVAALRARSALEASHG